MPTAHPPTRIFYSVTFGEGEELRQAIREVSEEKEAIPVFVDEMGAQAVPILQAIRSLISSCDLVIAVYTRPQPNTYFELKFAEELGKPVRTMVQGSFAQRLRSSADFLRAERKQYVFFSLKEFRSILSGIIRRFARSLTAEKVTRRIQEHNVVNNLRTRLPSNVLILGNDSSTEGKSKLTTVSNTITGLGFVPQLLRNIPDTPYFSLERKLLSVGASCRFVVLEESTPSGAIDELRICATNEFVTAILKEAGRGSTYMQFHYPIMYSFMARFCYFGNPRMADGLCDLVYDSLEHATTEGAGWADGRLVYQEKMLRSPYDQFSR
jgi:nucleoside 2-deoxyribosyltransferase